MPHLLHHVRSERDPVAGMIDPHRTATVPTQWGDFTCHAYRRPDGIEHLALVLGALDDAHSCACTASASPATCSRRLAATAAPSAISHWR